MSLGAGARLGPYEIVGLLGAGGMGEVYKARDTRLDRPVTICSRLPLATALRISRAVRSVLTESHPGMGSFAALSTAPWLSTRRRRRLR
jgi:serine/threonine protein kinase